MYKLFFILIVAALAVALISCSSEQKQQETTAEMPEMTTTAVSDTAVISCAGCDMQHTKAEMTAHEIDGETKYFCSDACKDHYMAKMEEDEKESSEVN